MGMQKKAIIVNNNKLKNTPQTPKKQKFKHHPKEKKTFKNKDSSSHDPF